MQKMRRLSHLSNAVKNSRTVLIVGPGHINDCSNLTPLLNLVSMLALISQTLILSWI